VYVGRVYLAVGCKINFQICIEVTFATAHLTRNLVEFQHTPAGQTRPTYTLCGLKHFHTKISGEAILSTDLRIRHPSHPSHPAHPSYKGPDSRLIE
jgi:hypothetical protein